MTPPPAQPNSSETPETDAAKEWHDCTNKKCGEYVLVDVARKLENERNALRTELERANRLLAASGLFVDLRFQLDESQRELEQSRAELEQVKEQVGSVDNVPAPSLIEQVKWLAYRQQSSTQAIKVLVRNLEEKDAELATLNGKLAAAEARVNKAFAVGVHDWEGKLTAAQKDTARLDALLTLDIAVVPLDGGKYKLTDFRCNPHCASYHATGRDAIDAAIAAPAKADLPGPTA